MKYCQYCGTKIDEDENTCPKCGKEIGHLRADRYLATVPETSPSKAPMVLGILAVVFGALGGLAGLVCGIIGLSIDKEKKYRVLNIIGIALFVMWVVIFIVYFAMAKEIMPKV